MGKGRLVASALGKAVSLPHWKAPRPIISAIELCAHAQVPSQSPGQLLTALFAPWVNHDAVAAPVALPPIPVVPANDLGALKASVASISSANSELRSKIAGLKKEIHAYRTEPHRERRPLPSFIAHRDGDDSAGDAMDVEGGNPKPVSLAQTEARVQEFSAKVSAQLAALGEDEDDMLMAWLSITGLGKDWFDRSEEGHEIRDGIIDQWKDDNAIDRRQWVAATDLSNFADDRRDRFLDALPILKEVH